MTNETIVGPDSPANPESETASPVPATQPGGSVFARLLQHHNAPYVFGAVILAAAALFVVVKKTDVALPTLISGPRVVLFDPVKFVNAQRAAASILVASPNADLTLTMTQVAKQAEAVIREEAAGSIILVKQAVVAGDDLPDITDRVLRRFGLPTDVPTVSTKPDALESVAPTDLAFSSGQIREDYRLELQQRSDRLMAEQQKKDRQSSVLP